MDEEVRSGDPRKERPRRIGLWLVGLGFFTLCVGYAMIQIMVPGETALQRWMAEQRAKGERFDIDALFPQGFGDASTNRIGDVERLLSMLDPRLYEMAGETLIVGSNGIATPVWHLPVAHRASGSAVTNVPDSWSDWAEAVDDSQTELNEIIRLLPVPDRDLGDALRVGSSVKLYFVKKRQLAHQLAAVIMVELQRGNPRRAKEILDAFLHWPEWHADYKVLIGQMIRVAVARLLLDVQWSVLQYPGWNDAELLSWQRYWQTNVLIGEFPMMLRVERAFMFEQFEILKKQGTAPVFTVRGSRSGIRSRVAGKIWSAFLADADQLFYGRYLGEYIEAVNTAAEARNLQSVAIETARLRMTMNTVLKSIRGRFYLVSNSGIPSFEKMISTGFEYESDREIVVTGIALTRHRIKYGEFPADLEALVPAFIPRLPSDWMTGGMLIYRRIGDDEFELRSVGVNGIDEGGQGDDILWYRSTDRTNGVGKASDTP